MVCLHGRHRTLHCELLTEYYTPLSAPRSAPPALVAWLRFSRDAEARNPLKFQTHPSRGVSTWGARRAPGLGSHPPVSANKAWLVSLLGRCHLFAHCPTGPHEVTFEKTQSKRRQVESIKTTTKPSLVLPGPPPLPHTPAVCVSQLPSRPRVPTQRRVGWTGGIPGGVSILPAI